MPAVVQGVGALPAGVLVAVLDTEALLVEASAAFVLDKVAFVVERTADAASVASGLVVPILVVQVLTVMP